MTNSEFKKELKKAIKYASSDTKYSVKYVKNSGNVTMARSNQFNMKEYIHLHGLRMFIKVHKDLSDLEIENMLRDHKITFKFLNKYLDVVDNGVAELRKGNTMSVLMLYRQNCIFNEEHNNSKAI